MNHLAYCRGWYCTKPDHTPLWPPACIRGTRVAANRGYNWSADSAAEPKILRIASVVIHQHKLPTPMHRHKMLIQMLEELGVPGVAAEWLVVSAAIDNYDGLSKGLE